MKESEPYASYKAKLKSGREIRFHLYLNGSVKVAINKFHPGFDEEAMNTHLVRKAFSLLPGDVTEIKELLETFKSKVEKGEIKP